MVSPLVTEFITHSADNSFYLQTKDVVVLRMCIIYRIVGAGPGGGGHCLETEHHNNGTIIITHPHLAAEAVSRGDPRPSSSRIADDVHTKNAFVKCGLKIPAACSRHCGHGQYGRCAA